MTSAPLRVEFKPDGSVYISPSDSESRREEDGGALETGRMTSGTVDDAETGAPIPGAYIGVVGTQLVGAPNEAWSNERGGFSLRVPEGEVWLDASARGYEFSRVTLRPTDSVAVFHGRSTGECFSLDTAHVIATPRRLARDLFFAPAFIIGGKVLGRAKKPTTECGLVRRQESGRVQIKIF